MSKDPLINLQEMDLKKVTDTCHEGTCEYREQCRNNVS